MIESNCILPTFEWHDVRLALDKVGKYRRVLRAIEISHGEDEVA